MTLVVVVHFVVSHDCFRNCLGGITFHSVRHVKVAVLVDFAHGLVHFLCILGLHLYGERVSF
jgi:hypothetical protein